MGCSDSFPYDCETLHEHHEASDQCGLAALVRGFGLAQTTSLHTRRGVDRFAHRMNSRSEFHAWRAEGLLEAEPAEVCVDELRAEEQPFECAQG